jgi:hypothetical protein
MTFTTSISPRYRRKMMATKPWREIRAERSKLTQEQRDAIDAQVLADVSRMHLPELRKARQLTQETVAELSQMAQGDVSKLERRTDAYIGTLRRYVRALGGNLRILAEFPDSEPIEIEGFGDIEPPQRVR